MEGITILSTHSEMIWTDSTFILVISLLVITLCIAVVMCCCNNTPLAVNIFAFVVGIICFSFALLIMAFGPKEPHTTYKVLIDESVNLLEFNQKYTIKDQDGQIYTIIEKDFSK
jgi:hypothetical protein